MFPQNPVFVTLKVLRPFVALDAGQSIAIQTEVEEAEATFQIRGV